MQCGEPLRLVFQKYMHNVRNECLGKLAYFWLIYIDTMSTKYKNWVFVQEKWFSLRSIVDRELHSFIPICFCYYMHKYARYVSYYVQVLKSTSKNTMDWKKIVTYVAFNVESQDRYPLRTAINMQGKVTFNKLTKNNDCVTYSMSSSTLIAFQILLIEEKLSTKWLV